MAAADLEADLLMGAPSNNAGITTGQTEATLASPVGLAYDATRDRYLVADEGSVQRYIPGDGASFAELHGGDLMSVQSLVIVNDLLFVTDQQSVSGTLKPGVHRMSVVDGSSRTVISSAFVQSSLPVEYARPYGITVAPGPAASSSDTTSPHLYVTDTSRCQIIVIDPAIGGGTRTSTWYAGESTVLDIGAVDGPANQAYFWRPHGIAYNPPGDNFVVCDTGNDVVRVVSRSTGPIVSTRFGDETKATLPEDGALSNSGLLGVRDVALHPTQSNIFWLTFENAGIVAAVDIITSTVRVVVNRENRPGFGIGHVHHAVRSDGFLSILYVDARDELLLTSIDSSGGRVLRISNFADRADPSVLKPDSTVGAFTADGKRFELLAVRTTWQGAQNLCYRRVHIDKGSGVTTARGGRLATFLSRSSHERAFMSMASARADNAWVGARATAADEPFQWRFGPAWLEQDLAAVAAVPPVDPGLTQFSAGLCDRADNARLSDNCDFAQSTNAVVTNLFLALRRPNSNSYMGQPSSVQLPHLWCEYVLPVAEDNGVSYIAGMPETTPLSAGSSICAGRPETIPSPRADPMRQLWHPPTLATQQAARTFARYVAFGAPTLRPAGAWPEVIIGGDDVAEPNVFRWAAQRTPFTFRNGSKFECVEGVACRFSGARPTREVTESPRYLLTGASGAWRTAVDTDRASGWACSAAHEAVDLYGTKQYFLPSGARKNATYAEAVAMCEAESTEAAPTRLAMIATGTEADTLMNMVAGLPLKDQIWLRDIDPWTHVNGAFSPPSFNASEEALCATSARIKRCPTIGPNATSGVVCERHLTNGMVVDGASTRFMVTSLEKMNAADAKAHCEGQSAKLPGMTTELTAEALGTLVRAAFSHVRRASVWLGGSCSGGNCEWTGGAWEAGPTIMGLEAQCWQPLCGVFGGRGTPLPTETFANLATTPDGRVVGVPSGDAVEHYVVCEAQTFSSSNPPVLKPATPAPTPQPTPAPTTTEAPTTTTTTTEAPVTVPNTTAATTTAPPTTTAKVTTAPPSTTAGVVTTAGPATPSPPPTPIPVGTDAPPPTPFPTPVPPPPPPVTTFVTATHPRTVSASITASKRTATASRPLTVSRSRSNPSPSLTETPSLTPPVVVPTPQRVPMPASERLMGTVVDPQSAQAITASSQSAVLASAAVSPAAATKGANLAAIATIVECEYAADDVEPSWIEVGPVWAFGKGELAAAIGPSLSVTLFVWLLHFTLAGTAVVAPRWRKRAGLFVSIVLAYCTPTVAGLTTTIAIHAPDASDKLLGIALYFLNLASFVCPLVLVARAPSALLERLAARTTAEAVELRRDGGESATDAYLMCFVSLYEPSRSLVHNLMRLLFFEDVIAAFAMATIAGVRPLGAGGCLVVGSLIIAVAVVHAVYVVFVRPFERTLDTGFAIVIAIGQVALAVCAVIVVEDTSWAPTLAYLAITQGVLFLVQTVATVIDSIINRHLKRKKEKGEDVQLPGFAQSFTKSGRQSNGAAKDAVGTDPLLRGVPAWSLAGAAIKAAAPAPPNTKNASLSSSPSWLERFIPSQTQDEQPRGRGVAVPVGVPPASVVRSAPSSGPMTSAQLLARMEAQLGLGPAVNSEPEPIAPSAVSGGFSETRAPANPLSATPARHRPLTLDDFVTLSPSHPNQPARASSPRAEIARLSALL